MTEKPYGEVLDELDHQAKYQSATINPHREQELRIQALGAAISRRDWHATERAYETIRDKFTSAPQDVGREAAIEECAKAVKQKSDDCRSKGNQLASGAARDAEFIAAARLNSAVTAIRALSGRAALASRAKED